MPAYNAERYVRAAIESVLDNGFADFELVVVDDASTDSTAQIIEAIRHPALRFVRQAENLGVGATRQAAISLLRGQYVALLDADDVAIPGRFQRQVDRLGAADGPDILGGGLEMFGEVQGTLTFPLTDAAIKCALLFHDLPLANPTICMRLNPFRSGRLAYSRSAAPKITRSGSTACTPDCSSKICPVLSRAIAGTPIRLPTGRTILCVPQHARFARASCKCFSPQCQRRRVRRWCARCQFA